MTKIIKKWQVFKSKSEWRASSTVYVNILEVYRPWDYMYIDKKRELNLKTNPVIIKYEKSMGLDFKFWYINYMTYSDFRYNFKEKVILNN